MSLRWTLDQLNPAMRAQAQRQMDAVRAVSNEKTHECKDENPTNGSLATFGPKKKRLNRPPLIPKLSKPEERLAFHLNALGLGGYVREHRFSQKRFWRFDFYWHAPKLAVEVNGGIHTQGRHTRGAGYERDREKINEAVILGIRVLEFTPRHVKSGKAARDIQRALEAFRT